MHKYYDLIFIHLGHNAWMHAGGNDNYVVTSIQCPVDQEIYIPDYFWHLVLSDSKLVNSYQITQLQTPGSTMFNMIY